MAYWLLKSEPSVFSFDDLQKAPSKITGWDGVRNYQARNFLRDTMQKGDGVLFYHSSTDPQAVMGTATIVRAGYPDATQFDAKSNHYDADSDPTNPRWFAVDIKLDKHFSRPVTLAELRGVRGLEDMILLKRGSRLSVQPVQPAEWKIICRLGGL